MVSASFRSPRGRGSGKAWITLPEFLGSLCGGCQAHEHHSWGDGTAQIGSLEHQWHWEKPLAAQRCACGVLVCGLEGSLRDGTTEDKQGHWGSSSGVVV